ncbi:MAG: hypothetical protein ACFCBU_01935 [Cyanophyceae cyanobacterium]
MAGNFEIAGTYGLYGLAAILANLKPMLFGGDRSMGDRPQTFAYKSPRTWSNIP